MGVILLPRTGVDSTRMPPGVVGKPEALPMSRFFTLPHPKPICRLGVSSREEGHLRCTGPSPRRALL